MSDIGEILNTYLHTPDFPSVRKLIEIHPILLSKETTDLLSNWIEGAINRGDIGRANALKAYQSQLRLFKNMGVDQANSFYNFVKQFVDMESVAHLSRAFLDFCDAENWDDRKRILELHPELLAPSARELLELNLDGILEQHPVLALEITSGLIYLDLCRELGAEGAEEWIESQMSHAGETLATSVESPNFPSVASLLLSRSLDTAKRIIEQHPELLTSEVDPIFEGLMENARKNECWERLFMLVFYYTILKDCRVRTVDIVFKELESQPQDLEGLLSALEKLASAPFQDRQSIIERNPTLISPFTDTLLELICKQLEDTNKPDLMRNYREWQLMLRYCREIGTKKSI